jgi:hypothetical protein
LGEGTPLEIGHPKTEDDLVHCPIARDILKDKLLFNKYAFTAGT